MSSPSVFDQFNLLNLRKHTPVCHALGHALFIGGGSLGAWEMGLAVESMNDEVYFCSAFNVLDFLGRYECFVSNFANQ